MNPLPPEPRKTLAARSKEVLEDHTKKEQVIARAFERVAKTEDGAFVLNKIFELSGFASPQFIMTAEGDISEKIFLVKQGRAGLWLDLRKYFTRESLIKIEYPEPKEVETKGKSK